MAGGRFSADAGEADVYYVVAHLHWILALEALFLVFAAIYLALERARRGQWRGRLGGLHLGLSFAGALLILSPTHVLTLAGGPERFHTPDAFILWNTIASAGYVLVLAAQVFFVAALLDALRREADVR